MGLLIIGINVTLCVGGSFAILVSFIWGCLDARKIHLRKKLGLRKKTGDKINNWRRNSKMNSKIVPVEKLSLEEVRKKYGASSEEYSAALQKFAKK